MPEATARDADVQAAYRFWAEILEALIIKSTLDSSSLTGNAKLVAVDIARESLRRDREGNVANGEVIRTVAQIMERTGLSESTVTRATGDLRPGKRRSKRDKTRSSDDGWTVDVHGGPGDPGYEVNRFLVPAQYWERFSSAVHLTARSGVQWTALIQSTFEKTNTQENEIKTNELYVDRPLDGREPSEPAQPAVTTRKAGSRRGRRQREPEPVVVTPVELQPCAWKPCGEMHGNAPGIHCSQECAKAHCMPNYRDQWFAKRQTAEVKAKVAADPLMRESLNERLRRVARECAESELSSLR